MSPLPSDRAQAALLRALKPWGPFTVLGARTVPWMSGTFDGARHRIALRLDGENAAVRAAELQAALPEAELPIRGGFVADIVVAARIESDAPVVAIEALTIDEPVDGPEAPAAPALARAVRRDARRAG
jgi:hypothetical protein